MKPLRDYIIPEDFLKLSENSVKLEFLLRYAHLAPSTRNVQPWFFKLIDSGVEVTVNRDRILPFSDFVGRQVIISIGAAIYNFKIAALAYGLEFETHYYTDNLENFKVIIKFSNLKSNLIVNRSDLQAILDRHNNRELYTEKTLPKDFINLIKSLNTENLHSFVVTEKNKLNKITDIVVEATDVAFSNKDFSKEAADWVRPSLQKYRDGMPAYNLGFPKLLSFFIPFIIRTFNTAKLQMGRHKLWLQHSPAVIVISSKGDDVQDWLAVGELFEKIVLEATKHNLKYAVMAAPTEIGDYYKDLQKVLNTNLRPQMFFRIGYADKKPIFTPRLDLKKVMK